ncbi:MAG: FliH/SctL family protein [Planctomycetota bacterium]|jgi:flagellar biosynthesis/type III secretory pathway protein FliH
MSGTLTVELGRPIRSVKIQGNNLDDAVKQNQLMQDLESQRSAFTQTCQTLQGVITKLGQLYDKALGETRGEIAKLSVEIAKKILRKKVEEGDYEIESIVKETLNNAPTYQDVVVRLNPEDLSKLEKCQQDTETGSFAGINFVSDANIGRAECLLESPKGKIESFINNQLEQIGQALDKVE